IAESFEYALGVSPVGLIAGDVRADGMGRQEDDSVAEGLELAAPVVGGAASLENHGRFFPLGKEAHHPIPRESVALGNLPRLVGDSNLEDRLREIDGDRRSPHLNSSFSQRTGLFRTTPARSCSQVA